MLYAIKSRKFPKEHGVQQSQLYQGGTHIASIRCNVCNEVVNCDFGGYIGGWRASRNCSSGCLGVNVFVSMAWQNQPFDVNKYLYTVSHASAPVDRVLSGSTLIVAAPGTEERGWPIKLALMPDPRPGRL